MALLQISEPGMSTAPHQHRLAVGIDLGTTNSLVATVRNGVPQCLHDDDGRVLLPSALLGAVMLLAADIGTRLMSYNTEIKLGVNTSIIGAPFFLWLVLSMRKRAP